MIAKKSRLLLALILCLLSVVTASCSNGHRVLLETDQARIYASVIMRLDHDQGGPPLCYIMGYTDDSAGTRSGLLGSKTLSTSLKTAVLTALAGTTKKYAWVDQFNEIPVDAVHSGAAGQIILGNIHLQEDGSVEVSASLFYGGTGGGGATFVLKPIDGVWTVTGTSGPAWVS